MSQELWSELAAELREAEASRRPIAPISPRLAAGDVSAAYEVQRLSTEASLAAGRRIVGRKIGITNPVAQRHLGVDQPDWGVLFADMAHADGAVVPIDAVMEPMIEAEMAFTLAADLDDPDASLGAVRAAVSHVSAAIEIAGSRVGGWAITITDTIADNASAGAFVVGSRGVAIDDVDLTGAAMTLRCNGEERSTGTAAACLGNPLTALHWLAREVARRGRPLRAGEVVMTGSLGPMVPARRGDRFVAHIAGLGDVSCSFD